VSFWKNKKVMITGGAGLIGSALSANLVKNGSKVTIVDNFERGKFDYIADIMDDCTIKNADLREARFCDVHIRDYDIVIHMASKVGGIGYYTSRPYEVMSENLKMDSNVLSACVKNKIPMLFYASSAHVYPKELQGTPDSPLIKEEQAEPANPELSYGWAKLITEKQIQAAVKQSPNFKASIARYIGIYGKNQDFGLDTGSVIPVFCNRAINHPDIEFNVWGNGKETRSYCFIEDAIEGTKKMIEAMDTENMVGPYNLGKQERVSIGEIAEKVIAISDKNIIINFDTSKDTLIWGQWCDCSKIKNDLGWEATTSLEDGLKVVYEDVKSRI
jgi:GDP-D-mannose 3',5'-epimerase